MSGPPTSPSESVDPPAPQRPGSFLAVGFCNAKPSDSSSGKAKSTRTTPRHFGMAVTTSRRTVWWKFFPRMATSPVAFPLVWPKPSEMPTSPAIMARSSNRAIRPFQTLILRAARSTLGRSASPRKRTALTSAYGMSCYQTSPRFGSIAKASIETCVEPFRWTSVLTRESSTRWSARTES